VRHVLRSEKGGRAQFRTRGILKKAWAANLSLAPENPAGTETIEVRRLVSVGFSDVVTGIPATHLFASLMLIQFEVFLATAILMFKG
jgi:hypothetical protein